MGFFDRFLGKKTSIAEKISKANEPTSLNKKPSEIQQASEVINTKDLETLKKEREALINELDSIANKYQMSDFERGNLLITEGRFNEAIELFDKVIELDSRNIEALANKGLALIRMGKNSEAIQVCDIGIKKDQHNVKLWLLKGSALAGEKKIDEAEAAFAKAKELGYTG